MSRDIDNASFDNVSARKALLAWFESCGRKFPWRDDPTPYRVWISEIMLQQTTTQTVIGYFERFVTRFPDVATLAAASEEETLKYWEGLGYYRRARALRAAAIEIVERFDGVFPSDYDDVLSLPGIGRYAVGAILSFGFDKRAAILEANTTRLHARLLGLREETTLANSQKTLWRFAEEWLPEESKRRETGVYRNINAALTDLGRMVCSPSSPNCGACPLARFCESNRLGIQDVVPVLKKKQETIPRVDVDVWITRQELSDAKNVKDDPGITAGLLEPKPTDVLLVLRRQGVLWAGLWEFPRFEAAQGRKYSLDELPRDAYLKDRLQYFLEEEVGATSGDRGLTPAEKTIRHSVTRYRIELALCRSTAEGVSASERQNMLFELEPRAENTSRDEDTKPAFCARQAEELRWVPVEKLAEYPLSSPGRRLADYIVKKSQKKN